MSTAPRPPQTYEDFVHQFPRIGQAWQMIGEAGQRGPLDEKTARLVKLGLAIGNQREGAVHANVRKAIALGISSEAIYQVVALSAGTLGLSSTVAAYSWVQDALDGLQKT